MFDPKSRDPAQSDRDLILSTAAGDRHALEQLVARHGAAALRLAQTVTGDAAAAEDAVQQTFLAVFQHASTFRADASVRSWILTIARNAASRMLRRSSRENLFEEPWIELGIEAGWGSDDPEAMAMAAEQRNALQDAMSLLSAEDREALLLRDIEGLTGAEAAAVIGIGERALKSRLHRARLRLAAALRRGSTTEAMMRKGNPP